MSSLATRVTGNKGHWQQQGRPLAASIFSLSLALWWVAVALLPVTKLLPTQLAERVVQEVQEVQEARVVQEVQVRLRFLLASHPQCRP